jgi:hypothetical protein
MYKQHSEKMESVSRKGVTGYQRSSPGICLEGPRKAMKALIKTESVLAEMLTRHLPNTDTSEVLLSEPEWHGLYSYSCCCLWW